MNDQSAATAPEAGPNHATVFIWIFAVSAIWHYTSSADDIINYWFTYNPLVTPLVFLSIATAFIGALFPNKTAGLLIFSTGQLIAISLRFPFVADHLVMELFLNLCIVLSYAYLAITRRSFAIPVADMFTLFSPAGRWLLIIMYFFGTFHKLNPGFMSAASSCAVPFISGFPLPESVLGQPWVQYSAIYATLILEFAAMIMLLFARTKYWGMLLGMSFHFIIGISGYGTLAHFSAFALALHVLFLPSGFGQRIYNDPLVPAILKSASNFKVLTIAIVGMQVLFAIHMANTRQGFLVNSLFAAFALTVIYLVSRYGQMRADDAPYRLRSPLLPLNFVPVWFFLHCLSPYVGLGTGGTIAMFSGLHTEGGISNHYVITEPLRLFPYQDDVVYIENASNPSLQAAGDDGQGIVLFDFQRHITQRETLTLPLQLRVGERRYSITDANSLVEFANAYFVEQPWLARKYMSFRLVDEPQPNRCRH
jgi:hypothetical protein